MMTDLEKQIQFIMELDRIKHIIRRNYLADGSRRENDAEHSWHLAVMAMVLAEHANQKIDVLRTIKMLLIHDVVEIDAGDTYAYDANGHKDKREREVKAAERIFCLLPGEQAIEFRKLWDEFEEMETAEAKFANALDKIHPFLLNAASNGKSWQEHGIKKSQVIKINERTHEGSEALWQYIKEQIDLQTANGNLKRASMYPESNLTE